MKSIKHIILALSCSLALLTLSCSKSKSVDEEPADPPGAPAKTWQEHWPNHDMLVTRTFYDDNLVVYYDNDMLRSVTWVNKTLADSWIYVKKNYGAFGDDGRLYAILHRVVDFSIPGGGGHPATYLDASHDFHNAIDVGLGNWTYPTGEPIGICIHEIGHIVEGANNGVHGSPSFPIWGDSKIMEIFNYDVLMNIGREDEAARAYDECMAGTDIFPRAGTAWFKNWFYPIYAKYGKGAVLSRYFVLLSKNFPQVNKTYTRDMNWGEFIHFWSGAAGVNLKEQATIAFGWTDELEAAFVKAQKDFPNVTYTNPLNSGK